MSLEVNGENRPMASRAVPKPDSQRKDAARRIATLIEEHMTKCGLSEREKNKRVKQFAKRVDKATHRAKRP